jgi:phosphoadenosine phosphosulfate reductase
MTHAIDEQERIGSQAADPPLLPTPDVLEDLAAMSQLFETAEPEAILEWAVSRYGDGFTMATAFGPEGMVILEMLSRISPITHVFNLDTGYQFPETIALRNKVAERYKIEVELMKPELTVIEYEKLHGGPLYQRDPNHCCGDRKLAVLTRAALGKYAWASAIRRDQSPDRARASIVGWDKKFHLVKISPLANWTKKQVWDRILKHVWKEQPHITSRTVDVHIKRLREALAPAEVSSLIETVRGVGYRLTQQVGQQAA